MDAPTILCPARLMMSHAVQKIGHLPTIEGPLCATHMPDAFFDPSRIIRSSPIPTFSNKSTEVDERRPLLCALNIFELDALFIRLFLLFIAVFWFLVGLNLDQALLERHIVALYIE